MMPSLLALSTPHSRKKREKKDVVLIFLICVQATKRNETTVEMTSEYFLVATGERPRYPNIPGAKEFAISRYADFVFFCVMTFC